MRPTYIYRIVLVVLISTLLGCAHTSNYSKSLNKATQKGHLYDLQTWNADVIWNATFFSDKFRREYAKEYTRLNHMGPVESARFMAKQAVVQDEYWEFYVTIYTKKHFKDFSMRPDSFWKIQLTTAKGAVVEPTSIKLDSKDAEDIVMFPHLDRWSKSYRVIFPKVELGDKAQLTLKSMVGKSTLTWKLK